MCGPQSAGATPWAGPARPVFLLDQACRCLEAAACGLLTQGQPAWGGGMVHSSGGPLAPQAWDCAHPASMLGPWRLSEALLHMDLFGYLPS